jgi:hypothetical protein
LGYGIEHVRLLALIGSELSSDAVFSSTLKRRNFLRGWASWPEDGEVVEGCATRVVIALRQGPAAADAPAIGLLDTQHRANVGSMQLAALTAGHLLLIGLQPNG